MSNSRDNEFELIRSIDDDRVNKVFLEVQTKRKIKFGDTPVDFFFSLLDKMEKKGLTEAELTTLVEEFYDKNP